MSERLIIGLEAGADWVAIRQRLVDEGADWSRDPSPEQPDVLVVSIPERRDVEEVVRLTRQISGVRYVERDVMRWSL